MENKYLTQFEFNNLFVLNFYNQNTTGKLNIKLNVVYKISRLTREMNIKLQYTSTKIPEFTK